jgi:choline transport protein
LALLINFPISFAHINPGLDVPVRTLVFTYVFNALFGLLYLGPSVAFGAYVSSCTIFLNVSYVFPVVILLIRGRGVLKEWQPENTYFALGKAGWFLNIVAALFVIITSVVGLPVLDICACIRLWAKLT